MLIRQIQDSNEKKRIIRGILEELPDWFGIPESREEYIRESEEQICVVAFNDASPVGFLCLKETGKDTLEIAVMGVLKEYHRQGIGRELFHMVKQISTDKGYSFLQVKTVEMGRYEEYDKTNKFYISLGFKELEVFKLLWDEHNPCQIYILSLHER